MFRLLRFAILFPLLMAVTADSTPTNYLLTVSEVSRMLRISRSGVYNLLRAGDLPAFKMGKATLRIPSAAVHAYIERAYSAPAS